MIIDKYIEPYWNRIWLWFRKGVVFIIVTILWIPFRADSRQQVTGILRGLGNFGTDAPTEFYQTMLPRIANLINISGLLTGDTVVMVQKNLIFVFVMILLLIVFLGNDVTYLREKYCDKIWMMWVCGGILSLSVMQFAEAMPTFIYEGF